MELRPIIKTRKSGFEDAFFVIAIIFTIVIFLVILAKVWGDIYPTLSDSLTSATPDGDTTFNVSSTFEGVDSTITMFDKLFPLVLIGLFGFVLIGASIYAEHPIMLFLGLIILAVVILLAVIYANIYNQITQTEQFSETTSDFGISNIFMRYLPYVLFLMFIAIGAVVLWSRSKAGTSL